MVKVRAVKAISRPFPALNRNKNKRFDKGDLFQFTVGAEVRERGRSRYALTRIKTQTVTKTQEGHLIISREFPDLGSV